MNNKCLSRPFKMSIIFARAGSAVAIHGILVRFLLISSLDGITGTVFPKAVILVPGAPSMLRAGCVARVVG